MVVHSALPARLLVDDTHAYILIGFKGGNPVLALGIGGKVPLLASILVNSLNRLCVALILVWPFSCVMLSDFSE